MRNLIRLLGMAFAALVLTSGPPAAVVSAQNECDDRPVIAAFSAAFLASAYGPYVSDETSNPFGIPLPSHLVASAVSHNHIGHITVGGEQPAWISEPAPIGSVCQDGCQLCAKILSAPSPDFFVNSPGYDFVVVELDTTLDEIEESFYFELTMMSDTGRSAGLQESPQQPNFLEGQEQFVGVTWSDGTWSQTFGQSNELGEPIISLNPVGVWGVETVDGYAFGAVLPIGLGDMTAAWTFSDEPAVESVISTTALVPAPEIIADAVALAEYSASPEAVALLDTILPVIEPALDAAETADEPTPDPGDSDPPAPDADVDELFDSEVNGEAPPGADGGEGFDEAAPEPEEVAPAERADSNDSSAAESETEAVDQEQEVDEPSASAEATPDDEGTSVWIFLALAAGGVIGFAALVQIIAPGLLPWNDSSISKDEDEDEDDDDDEDDDEAEDLVITAGPLGPLVPENFRDPEYFDAVMQQDYSLLVTRIVEYACDHGFKIDENDQMQIPAATVLEALSVLAPTDLFPESTSPIDVMARKGWIMGRGVTNPRGYRQVGRSRFSVHDVDSITIVVPRQLVFPNYPDAPRRPGDEYSPELDGPDPIGGMGEVAPS